MKLRGFVRLLVRLSTVFYVGIVAWSCGAAKPGASGPPAADSGSPSMRITAYYAARNQGALPPSAIDFGTIREVIHASVRPNADGSLDMTQIADTDSTALVQAAHGAGRRVLVSVGGRASQIQFQGAIADANRDLLVHNIAALVQARGYDGVDVDMEPLGPLDVANYAKFVHGLRGQLGSSVLTAATSTEPDLFATLQADLDEINLLSYNLSGPFMGWQTWFDSPLFTAGHVFASNGQPLPSCDSIVQAFDAAGIDRHKLNLGMHFYGAIWTGAYGPNQSIAGVTLTSASYAEIVDVFGSTGTYYWESGVEAPYLSVHTSAAATDKFISYEDAALAAKKVAYVRQQGLGGLSIWELTGGHRSTQPAGAQDPLVDALKQAVAAP